MNPKSLFKSKTFWLNLGSLALTLAAPGIGDLVSAHPAVSTGLLTGANILTRLVTNQPVSLTGK